MPIDFIRADPTLTPQAVFARELLSLVSQLRNVIDQIDKVKAVMDHSNSGSNFASIETLFGLPANQGQTVYDLVNGTRGALGGTMQNSNALALIDRVG